jgi:energy-coupling factor transport system ATP-binding protein
MLRLEGVSYRHPGAAEESLRDVTLVIAEGTLDELTGPAGAGLSSLCLVLGGLAPRVVGGQLRGSLRLDGDDIAAWPMHRLTEHVVMGGGRPMAQLSLVAETVFEEVAFGPANLGLAREVVLARAWSGLEAMAVAGLAGRDPRDLSGGQQQLVALASLLAMGARHLVLDGALPQLDPSARRHVLDRLRATADDGAAVLLAEHRRDAVAVRCDASLRMSGGRLVDDVGALRGMPEADGEPTPAPSSTTIHVAIGPPTEAPDIDLEGVGHAYPSGVRALEGVDLHIAGGEAVAIVGANGSGKTTLARHLVGLLRPSRGRVLLGGRDIATRSVASLARSVALGFQDPDDQVFARRVADEVAFGPRHMGRDDAVVHRVVEAALVRVGLEAVRDAHPADLGESQRKLLTLASLLAMECPVLVLDEPTAGLDETGLGIVAGIVADELALGRTVIAISHDTPFVAHAFPRVVRLENGRVVADGRPEGVLEPPP